MKLIVANQVVQLTLRQQLALDIEFLGATTFIFSLFTEHCSSYGATLTFSLENQEEDNLLWRLDVIRVAGKWREQGHKGYYDLPQVVEDWLNMQQVPVASGWNLATA